MLVKCSAKECKHYKEGTCSSASIDIKDIEETENIKFKDKDFMACMSFEWKTQEENS